MLEGMFSEVIYFMYYFMHSFYALFYAFIYALFSFSDSGDGEILLLQHENQDFLTDGVHVITGHHVIGKEIGGASV